mgnify:CR=1 FL=1
MANPLSLFMPVLPGTTINTLLGVLGANQAQKDQALESIGTVHFARFLLLDSASPNLQPDMSKADVPTNTLVLGVITEYDGSFNAYISDFCAQLGTVFDAMLQYVVGGAAVIPVANNVAGFERFVMVNDASQHLPNTALYQAYPQTVQQILAAFS